MGKGTKEREVRKDGGRNEMNREGDQRNEKRNEKQSSRPEGVLVGRIFIDPLYASGKSR